MTFPVKVGLNQAVNLQVKNPTTETSKLNQQIVSPSNFHPNNIFLQKNNLFSSAEIINSPSSKAEEWNLISFVKPIVQNDISPKQPEQSSITKIEPIDDEQQAPYGNSHQTFLKQEIYQNDIYDEPKLSKSPSRSPEKHISSEAFESDEIESVLAEAKKITAIKPISSLSGEIFSFLSSFI